MAGARKVLTAAVAAFAAGSMAAPPVAGQSFAEAVQANVALGLRLCLAPGAPEALAAGFRAAGFAERVERSSSNSDTTHYFTAPADTAVVELYHGEMPEHCTVRSSHLGVSGASAVLDQVVPGLFPGFVRLVEQGPPDPATGQPALCVRYEDPANPIGLVIGALSGGDAPGCVADGTSTLFHSYRV